MTGLLYLIGEGAPSNFCVTSHRTRHNRRWERASAAADQVVSASILGFISGNSEKRDSHLSHDFLNRAAGHKTSPPVN